MAEAQTKQESRKEKLVICQRCQIPMKLSADGRLPKHWPRGYAYPSCLASNTTDFREERKK